ncbi:hypothetical protein FD888_17740 [Acinetobacter baumannii]|nr:hypothetical protein FD888_17740 [Acinetobacter baumannii]
MMSSLKILITKLSTAARTALEKSANACVLQQNYEIEIEHLFLELLNQPLENDLKIWGCSRLAEVLLYENEDKSL